MTDRDTRELAMRHAANITAAGATHFGYTDENMIETAKAIAKYLDEES